jgi:hypothetical protein
VVLDELSVDGRSVLVACMLTGFRSSWRDGQRVMPFFRALLAEKQRG